MNMELDKTIDELMEMTLSIPPPLNNMFLILIAPFAPSRK